MMWGQLRIDPHTNLRVVIARLHDSGFPTSDCVLTNIPTVPDHRGLQKRSCQNRKQ